MSSTAFPVNDLLRRRLQTGLTVATLTLSVASTLFLLLFILQIEFDIRAQGVLTIGLTAVYTQFLLFILVIIFIVGAVLTAFIIFLMMNQRTRDIGLIKAAGCPNRLIAGYFITELLLVSVISCVLGVVLGFLVDFAAVNLLLKTSQMPNLWCGLFVFVLFFGLTMFFGLKPISNATKISAIAALSPVNYYNPTAEKKHKTISKRGLTWKLAQRSLFRRQSANVRIIVLLSAIFVLLAISIAGSIIARDTTTVWVQGAVNKDAVVIAHSDMGMQYVNLLATFSGATVAENFDYLDAHLAIPESLTQQLKAIEGVVFDERLIFESHVFEMGNYTIIDQVTYPVGDNREGDSLIIGLNPEFFESGNLNGRTITNEHEAIIGDSLANLMYSPSGTKIARADPLVEAIKIQNTTYNIVGVTVDPTMNSIVTYVPLNALQNTLNHTSSNLIYVQIPQNIDREATISQIKNTIKAFDADLEVFTLEDTVQKNINYLAATWSTILLLPFFSMISAALCLVGYMMLAADEQRQELGVLRAVGAKPGIITSIMSIQALIVLLASFGVGITLGISITVLILMPNPVISAFTVIEISVWFFAAIVAMFVLCLYPALKLRKSAILRLMS
jgi:ABC-type antimicrobial peptide transport system permease subunit